MKSPLLHNCTTLTRKIFGVGNGSINLEILDAGQETECFIMYDLGTKTQMKEVYRNNKVLFKRIKEKGVETLFISHFDQDHVGGLKYLTDELDVKVKNCFIPFSDETAASIDILKYIVTSRKEYDTEQFEWLKDVLNARQYNRFEFSDEKYEGEDVNVKVTRFIYWRAKEQTEQIYATEEYNYKLIPFTYSVQYDSTLLANYNAKILACLKSIEPSIKSLNPDEIANNLDTIIKSLSNSNNKRNLKKLLNTRINTAQVQTDKYAHANSLLLRSDFLKERKMKSQECCYYCCCYCCCYCCYCNVMESTEYYYQYHEINKESIFFYTGDANFSDDFKGKWEFVAEESTKMNKNINYITVPHHGSYKSSGIEFYDYYKGQDETNKFILQTGINKKYKNSINRLITEILNQEGYYRQIVGGVLCETQIISCVGEPYDLILSEASIGSEIELIGDKPY